MLVVDRHLRSETYATATAVLVDANKRIHSPRSGATAISRLPMDNSSRPAGGRGEASLDYNAKYGKRPGASIYGFLSNRFASFFSRMIQASESEAPYVLDGLLHNELRRNPRARHRYRRCHRNDIRHVPRLRLQAYSPYPQSWQSSTLRHRPRSGLRTTRCADRRQRQYGCRRAALGRGSAAESIDRDGPGAAIRHSEKAGGVTEAKPAQSGPA